MPGEVATIYELGQAHHFQKIPLFLFNNFYNPYLVNPDAQIIIYVQIHFISRFFYYLNAIFFAER
jgi:hypothetical protein